MASLPPTQIHEDSESDGEPRTWAVVLVVLAGFAVLTLLVLGLRWLDRCPGDRWVETSEEVDGQKRQCAADVLHEPSESPPSQDPPHPSVATLTVEGNRVTDSQDVTGWCIQLFLWSEAGGGGEWLPVETIGETAQLVTADFRDEDGNIDFCPLGGLLREATYDLPLGDMTEGWYVVCNLSNQCSEPFETTQ